MIKQFLRLLRTKSFLCLILLCSSTFSLVKIFWRPNLINRDGYGADYDQDQTMFDIDRVKSKLLSMQRDREDKSNSIQSNFINEINYPEASEQTAPILPLANNGNSKPGKICRNSVQGKVLIADDRGYICPRQELTSGGCCRETSAAAKQFSCETCLANACCAIYEYCISCCMEPSKKPLLKKIISKGASPSAGVLFASITDEFEFCLTKCRTSSQSVKHENSYRDPKAKHCYGEFVPNGINNSKARDGKEKDDPNG